MKMRTPTVTTYDEYYSLDTKPMNQSYVLYRTKITGGEVADSLDIELNQYFDTLTGRYKITKQKDQRNIIHYVRNCSPGQGCKMGTKIMDCLPKEITDLLKDFPEHIRDLAGVLR